MFSKYLIICVAILAAITTLFVMVMVAITLDLAPLSVLIPAVFGQFGIAAGFYFNKAKAENQIKLRGWNEFIEANDSADIEHSDIEDGRG